MPGREGRYRPTETGDRWIRCGNSRRERLVTPWLDAQFDLPGGFAADHKHQSLMRMATWATEKAKIELSSKDEAVASASESELATRDESGREIYLDVPIGRPQLDSLIAEELTNSIREARETIEKAGVRPEDIERIVFVGGPTIYAPLREKVAFELGIAPSTEVNAMTAVAEGAAVFAESIDWSSQGRRRKSARGTISPGGGLNVAVNYVARTPEPKAKIGIKISGQVITGAAFQVDSLDTGWSSGRIDLKDGAVAEVGLAKAGDNAFKLFVFDANGGLISLKKDRIVITRTAATIDAIPASYSIALEVRDKVGGKPIRDLLVREGEQLPKTGRNVYKAEESLRAGSSGSLKFKLWEGEIEHPISDNRFIGLFELKGSDFETGTISAGSELICHYSIHDSGNIFLEVSVPSIGANFRSGNFYSRKGAGAGVDYSQAARLIIEDAQKTLERIDDVERRARDPLLDRARDRLTRASDIRVDETDPETAKRAMDDVQEAKVLLAKARKANLRPIRQMELERSVSMFDECVRKYARPTEASAFDNLAKSAKRSIETDSVEFEGQLEQLQGKLFMILWRQDWFVLDRFKWYLQSPHFFASAATCGPRSEVLP